MSCSVTHLMKIIGGSMVRLLSIGSAYKIDCSLVILNASVARTENPSESIKFA